MTEILVSLILMIIGGAMIAAEARACEYERNNIGPVVFLFGALLMAATIAGFIWRFFT